MAKKKTTKTKKTSPRKKLKITLSKQQKIVLGSFLALMGIALIISFTSYFFTWQTDQSELGILDRTTESKNWLNTFGSNVGHFFVYKGFGIASFILAFLITLTGIYLFLDFARKQLLKFWFWGILVMIWLAIFFGFFTETSSLFSGIVGFEMNDLLQDYLGLTGAILVMVFLAIVYFVVRLKLTPDLIGAAFSKTKDDIAEDFKTPSEEISQTDYEKEVVETLVKEDVKISVDKTQPMETILAPEETIEEPVLKTVIQKEIQPDADVVMEVETVAEEETVEENLSKKLVEDFGQFDPTLELSNFKFPTIELLKDYTAGKGITINQEELEENKNRIVETLLNYKIGISNIKATVGPTVTLYEIVPEAGIRISKIKNLEDDIALSLSALGIRIIAPIPGRGTIGIEVPNKNPRIVSMRSAVASPKFQNAEMELPLTLGKTISNETFVVDLT